jgi:hypothetical protein
MRYLWLLSLFLLSGCYYPYYPYYGYGSYPYPPPAYPYGYSSPYAEGPPPPYTQQGTPHQPQQYGYGAEQPGYGGPPVPDPHNCGTPYEPMACTR